jgi:hypothetical protein
MGRYANQFVTLDFPDLSEEGDPIFIKIRNPKTVPVDKLKGATDPIDPETGEIIRSKAMDSGIEVIAGLIVDWHVYDGTTEDEDSEPMGLPATAELVRKLPMEIISRISDEIAKVTKNPQ